MPAKEGEGQQGFSEHDLQGLEPQRYDEIRKPFYRDPRIAERYDAHRIGSARSSREGWMSLHARSRFAPWSMREASCPIGARPVEKAG